MVTYGKARNAWANLGYGARNLVSRYKWQNGRWGPIPVNGMKIAVANSTCRYLDKQVTISRRWQCNLFNLKRSSKRAQDRGLHCSCHFRFP